MAITAETLIDLIVETRRAFAEVDTELDLLKIREAELRLKRQHLADEEEAFVASLERRFPGENVPESSAAKPDVSDSGVFQIPADDWSVYNRSEVVLRAIKELTDEKGFATPAEIEELLKSKNRDDTRDAIGAALAYLNRSEQYKIYSRARAQWVYGDAPA